ncbi:MAG TPA: tetratricopeptide repeat protein [Candidatus Acidoferrales bacterium]|nr:tetratricopeptide repeat protein [Candidatus Acidoferrales bacterium]
MIEEADALLEAVRNARSASDFLLLERLARDMIALGSSEAGTEAEAYGYYFLGIALSNLNRGSEAADATRQAIRLYEAAGDRFSAAKAMMNLGSIELDNVGNADQARRLYEASAPIVRELGDPLNLAITLGNLGEICRLEGDYRGALTNAEESLAIFSTLDDTDNTVWQLTAIAHYRFALRQHGAAIETMAQAYELLRENPNPRWLAWYFDTWFLIAAGLEQWDSAAELLAFSDKYRDEQNQPRLQAMLPWLSTPKERLARELPHDRLGELVAAGEALTIETAQRLAESIRRPTS